VVQVVDLEEVVQEDSEAVEDLEEETPEALVVEQVVLVVQVVQVVSMIQLEEVVVLLRKQFQVFLVMITLSLLRYQKPLSSVTVKWMEDIMLTQRLSAKLSIFVPTMGMVVSPSTASSVPMEPFSSSSILSVTGGSMLTALLQSNFIPSMTKLQLKEQLILHQVLPELVLGDIKVVQPTVEEEGVQEDEEVPVEEGVALEIFKDLPHLHLVLTLCQTEALAMMVLVLMLVMVHHDPVDLVDPP